MRQIPSKSQTNLGHISDKYKVYPSHSIQAFEYISILILLFCLSISILFLLTGKSLEVTYFNFLFVLFNKSQAASNQCMSDIVGFYKNPICVCTVYRVPLYILIIYRVQLLVFLKYPDTDEDPYRYPKFIPKPIPDQLRFNHILPIPQVIQGVPKHMSPRLF